MIAAAILYCLALGIMAWGMHQDASNASLKAIGDAYGKDMLDALAEDEIRPMLRRASLVFRSQLKFWNSRPE